MCHWQRLSNVHSNLCSLSANSEVEGNISSSMPTLVTSIPCSTPTTSLALSHRFLRILLYPDIKQVRRKKEIEGWLEGCISWVQGSLGLVLETSSVASVHLQTVEYYVPLPYCPTLLLPSACSTSAFFCPPQGPCIPHFPFLLHWDSVSFPFPWNPYITWGMF